MVSQFRYPDSRIQVFAKAPVPGQVKTRLVGDVSAEEAARIHARLIQHTLKKVCSSNLCPVELWCAPDNRAPFFRECAQKFDIELYSQIGDGLGERMYHALCQANQRNHNAILIGSDCPGLSSVDMGASLEALKLGKQAVLGTAEDGGYVLIGTSQAHPMVFSNIRWGGDQVTETTRRRFRQLEWDWWESGPFWDVDRPQDLHRLIEYRPAILARESDDHAEAWMHKEFSEGTG